MAGKTSFKASGPKATSNTYSRNSSRVDSVLLQVKQRHYKYSVTHGLGSEGAISFLILNRALLV